MSTSPDDIGMILITTGCRDWDDEFAIRRAILKWRAGIGSKLQLVFHGDCPSGADYFVERDKEAMGYVTRPVRADWRTHGNAAGPKRNEEMVRLALKTASELPSPVAVRWLAFWDGGSRGTLDCIKRLVKYGITGRIVPKRRNGITLPALPRRGL